MAARLRNLKKVALRAIERYSAELYQLNQKIWKTPELGYQEKYAHEVLTTFFEEKGFEVTREYTIDTAFRASSGGCSRRIVGLICEYDALPGIGHACGHNLIAEVGVGAALGVKAAIDSSNQDLGKVIVLGTPAEEGGGGKIRMIENGCFDEVDFCLMAHPKSFSCVYPTCLAMQDVQVTFSGLSSHAAAFPWEGINALDAAVMAYNALSVLRQQLRPTWRFHGIITNGGSKPNIIPDKASMAYYVRAPTEEELNELRDKVHNCFLSAAQATGCTVDIEWNSTFYSNLETNEQLAKVYQGNAEELGLTFPSREEQAKATFGSTDMGNVSHVKPSIHPYFDIETSVANHTPEFTEAAGKKEAHELAVVQAQVMALTALDVLCSEQIWESVVSDFETKHGTLKPRAM